MTKETASQLHNRLAMRIVGEIIAETWNSVDALVLLESVIVGVLMVTQQTSPEYINAMSLAVIERLKK